MNILSMKFIFMNFTVRSEAVIRISKVQAQTVNHLQLQNGRGKKKKKEPFLNKVDL